MKKILALVLAALLTASLAACQPGTDTSSAVSTPSSQASETASGISSTYSIKNAGYQFTFNTPDRLKNDRCKGEFLEKQVMDNQEIEYATLRFIFDGDNTHPLLSILAVPADWWNDINTMPDCPYTLLSDGGATVFVYQRPTASPYSDEEKSALFNSLVPLEDEIKTAFIVDSVEPYKTESAAEPALSSELQQINKLVCTLEDGAMMTIIVKTVDGRSLTFNKEDAEVDIKDGLLIGQQLILTYTGDIKGTDTTNTKLLKIELDPDAASSAVGSAAASEAKPEDVKKLTCTFEDAAMSQITVKTEDGQKLSFNKDEADMSAKDPTGKGMEAGRKLILTYTGEINGTDTSGTKLVKVEYAP